MEILNDLEIPMQSRGRKGNRFFTEAVSTTMGILEVGQGFIIPWVDATDEGKKLLRRSIVFFGNKLGEQTEKSFVYGNLEQGLAVKRVG